jgi:hypothetical protein
MMHKHTGKVIHIDFGDCFEVAIKREKFPEKIPFRYEISSSIYKLQVYCSCSYS